MNERARAAAEFIHRVKDRQFEGCTHARTVYTTLCQWCVTDLVADAVVQRDQHWLVEIETVRRTERIAREDAVAQAVKERDEELVEARTTSATMIREQAEEIALLKQQLDADDLSLYHAYEDLKATHTAAIQAAVAAERDALKKAKTALQHVSVTSSRYRSHRGGCQSQCSCDAGTDDKLVKTEMDRVIQPALLAITEALRAAAG